MRYREPPSFDLRRSGWLMSEVVISLAALAAVSVVVAEITVGTLTEKRRTAFRQDAIEATANELEAARATPWDELTPEWAKAQKLPESFTSRWPDARLTVRVDNELGHPRIKRVTADLHSNQDHYATLTALFSARKAGGTK